MSMEIDTLEKAREYFKDDKYASETTGIVIEEAGKDYAKCTLQIGPQHLNANKTVMGGALFTLADMTCAVAANFMSPSTVSVSSQITYLNATGEGELTAIATCEKSGRRTCTHIIHITDEREKEIAVVTGTGLRVE